MKYKREVVDAGQCMRFWDYDFQVNELLRDNTNLISKSGPGESSLQRTGTFPTPNVCTITYYLDL